MNFIEYDLLPLDALDKSYDPALIILSVIIAILTSFTAFGFSERMRSSSSSLQQYYWLVTGASVMGAGVWAMHFLGSLALQLGIHISYNIKITLISAVPAMFASAIVLWQMNKPNLGVLRLLGSGLLMGSCVGLMHYTGMAAMELNAEMLHIKSIFILSLIVSVVFATLALKLKSSVIQLGNYQFVDEKQGFSAVVMGFAISGMHYTAMKAVIFVPSALNTSNVDGANVFLLSTAVSLTISLVLIFAIIFPHILRFKELIATLQKNEEDLKIAAIAFQAQDALVVTDDNGNMLRVNDAFCRITGYAKEDVIGKNPWLLQSGKHDQLFYKRYWDTIIDEGKWTGEVWNRRKSGEIFPVWQTVSALKNTHGNITHYISSFSDTSDSKVAEKAIEKLAFYDPLTELPNRRLLHDRLEHELSVAKRYGRVGMLFFLDLDRFKNINDSLGHSVGDQLLVETAKRLQSLLRDVDTAVRLGGDEFVILIGTQDGIHADLLEQSHAIARKIINKINEPFVLGEHELFVSTSIGITLYMGIDETVELLLKRADTAMYQAKAAGRNTFRFYHQYMQDAADNRLKIEKNLRLAIANDELSLHYQPQLSRNGVIIGAEALIRWKSAELGDVQPDDFIPIAEETGVIIMMGEWVVESVCTQIKAWDEQGIHVPHVAINISAKQFHQADFVSVIVHHVLQQKVGTDRVMLEITESVFLGSLEDAIDKMNILKTSGFNFSIDDFGTGYSSLTYLKRLPFDQLKIDQSFVRELVNNATDAAIVKAIIVMAKSMNLKVIAEGVETDQHLAYLAAFGCQDFQGYYFSKPLTADDFSHYFKAHMNTK